MDVKSAFLNDLIEEEVFVKQPLSFESHLFPEHVYKLKRLYTVLNKPLALGMIG